LARDRPGCPPHLANVSLIRPFGVDRWSDQLDRRCLIASCESIQSRFAGRIGPRLRDAARETNDLCRIDVIADLHQVAAGMRAGWLPAAGLSSKQKDRFAQLAQPPADQPGLQHPAKYAAICTSGIERRRISTPTTGCRPVAWISHGAMPRGMLCRPSSPVSEHERGPACRSSALPRLLRLNQECECTRRIAPGLFTLFQMAARVGGNGWVMLSTVQCWLAAPPCAAGNPLQQKVAQGSPARTQISANSRSS